MSWDANDKTIEYTTPFQLTKKIIRNVPSILSPENPRNSAEGKIIVITGGATGIGLAAAEVWIRAGAAGVVIAGRRKEVLDRAAAKLGDLANGSTKVLAIQTDVTKVPDTDKLFAQIKQAFNRPADVVLSNAGAITPMVKPHEESSEKWWTSFEVNTLGTHNLATSFIRSQADPTKPVGTFISTNSGLAGIIEPGLSGYSIAKLAAQRYIEYLDAEYPSLRSFTLFPGIVVTDMLDPAFATYALDQASQTGAVVLYLASPRSDYLKGSLMSVNWDVEEMEGHAEEIRKGILRIKYVPVLPVSGGKGFWTDV
ncbi:short chain dehydrogenase-like protein [Setomelanomma holmii]|uniref:Short chain dehydrogenase-like protein n=1 Tax=Setomelanomma holmii TaxID=210430 RepID=A0A9P4H723_9PLEO|nr:short chain dehydrogenase-like protein [Setomelanomma holmii]